MSRSTRVRTPFARRPLGLEPLERRDTPSFTVGFDPLSGAPTFRGDDADDYLVVEIDPYTGYIKHNLVQPDLASPFDLDTSLPGEQPAVGTLPTYDPYGPYVAVYGGGGNDLIASVFRTVADGGAGDDTILTGSGDDFIIASPGADQIDTGGMGLRDTFYIESAAGGTVVSDTGYTLNGDTGGLSVRSGTASGLHDLIINNLSGGLDAGGFTGTLTVYQTATATGAAFALPTDRSDLRLAGDNNTVTGGAGADGVVVSGTGNAIDLAGGDDGLTVTGPGNTIAGGAGGDSLYLQYPVAALTVTAAALTADGVVSAGHGFERVTAFGQGSATLDASAFGGWVSFTGGTGPSVLKAGAGGSILVAGSGAVGSTLAGGAGDDSLSPSGNADTFSPGPGGVDFLYLTGVSKVRGTDTALTIDGKSRPNGFEYFNLTGTAKNDVLDFTGFAGRTVLYGLEGDDVLRSGDGALAVSVGVDGNYLHGGPGNDLLVGGASGDTLIGFFGNDTLRGGAGNDSLVGDDYAWFGGPTYYSGDDSLDGGAGDDFLDAGSGRDRASGGAGTDSLYLADVSTLRLTDTSLVVNGVTTTGPALENVYVFGTAGANRLDATGYTRGRVDFRGLGGADTLRGGEGDDYLLTATDGTSDAAELYGNGGNDSLQGGGRLMDGGAGDDSGFDYSPGATVLGGAGYDQFTAYGANSSVSGGAGTDFVFGFAPGCTVSGGDGDDYVGVSGGSVASGDGGNDVVSGTTLDRLSGGAGTDRFEFYGQLRGVVLTDTRLVVDGAVVWTDHGFESGSISVYPPEGVLLGVSVDAVGFTRGGPLDIYTSGYADTVRVNARAAGTIDLGDSDGDTLVVVGAAGKDAFAVAETAATEQSRGFLTVTDNGESLTAYGVRALRLDGLGGANTLSVPAPLSVPLSASGFAPVVAAGGDQTLAGRSFTRTGSFTDPGLGQTWTAAVDFGDGTGSHPLTLNPDGTFALAHTYTRRGTFTVRVTVTDSEGNVGVATFQLTVR